MALVTAFHNVSKPYFVDLGFSCIIKIYLYVSCEQHIQDLVSYTLEIFQAWNPAPVCYESCTFQLQVHDYSCDV